MLNRRTLTALALPILFLLFGSEASAQFSFTALDGIPTAQKKISDSLGAGSKLVAIATIGNLDVQGIPLEFNAETGESVAWIYAFSTPSGDIATIAVVRLFAFLAFSIGDVPLPLPDGVLPNVETDGEYADSDKMIAQLKTNATYASYRNDFPDYSPSFVVLGQLLGNVDLLPDDFPLTQSIWTVSFTGQGDSAMTCFVASKSGQTFCIERPDFLSVDEEEMSAHQLALQTMPNPTVEQVTITIESQGVPLAADAHLLLLNSVGETVLDLSDDPGLLSGRITVSTEDLPAGLYHLILQSEGKSRRHPLVILR